MTSLEQEVPPAVATLLIEYLATLDDRSKAVVDFKSPDELYSIFADASVPLAIASESGEEKLDVTSIVDACKLTLAYSARTAHPYFFNQLYGRVDRIGLAAEWVASSLNTNVHTYEVAPVFTMMEIEVLKAVANLIGGQYSSTHDGLLVPGGSIANLYGAQLARHKAHPSLRTSGMQVLAKPLTIFVSDQSHYSYVKLAMLMGIGQANVIKVQSNEDGSISVAALRERLDESLNCDQQPFMIGATCGSTVMGAFDDLNALADVCEEYGLWLHADGAWGAPALFDSSLRGKHMNGIDRCDSLAWNPHKLMGLPLQCSVFITKHMNLLKEANCTHASYLFQSDKEHGNMDIGDKTFMCGRKADSFKLWLTWKTLGTAGLQERVQHCMKIAEHFEKRVKEREAEDGSFVLALPRSFANVCFWYVPPTLRPLAEGQRTKDSDVGEKLHLVAPMIKKQMQSAGDALIGFQPVKGLSNCFRIVFPNASAVTLEDVDVVLDSIAKHGQHIQV